MSTLELVELELDGARVRALDSGGVPGPDAAPLLYLHDAEHHPGPAPFLEALAERRRVIAPEYPGYGASEGGERIAELSDLVLYLRRLAGGLDAAPLDVVGHGLGGMVGAELAIWCPQLVRRLVLVGAYGLWLDDVPVPDPYTMSPDERRRAQWHDAGAAPEQEPMLAVPGVDDEHARAVLRAQNLAMSTKFLWPLPERGTVRRLHALEAPVLVVHGEADGLVPAAYAEAWAAAVPQGRVELMVGAAHLPMLERPTDFVAVVERFLS